MILKFQSHMNNTEEQNTFLTFLEYQINKRNGKNLEAILFNRYKLKFIITIFTVKNINILNYIFIRVNKVILIKNDGIKIDGSGMYNYLLFVHQ